jgi:hypothetical protein
LLPLSRTFKAYLGPCLGLACLAFIKHHQPTYCLPIIDILSATISLFPPTLCPFFLRFQASDRCSGLGLLLHSGTARDARLVSPPRLRRRTTRDETKGPEGGTSESLDRETLCSSLVLVLFECHHYPGQSCQSALPVCSQRGPRPI